MNIDQRIAMHAFAAYIYNTSGVKFAEDMFPGRHPDYMDEYAEAWGHSPARGIGKLNTENLSRLFEIMLNRYAEAPA